MQRKRTIEEYQMNKHAIFIKEVVEAMIKHHTGNKPQITIFSSDSQISLETFCGSLVNMIDQLQIDKEVLIISLIYLQRLSDKITISQNNVLRLLLVSTLEAIKFHDDIAMHNKLYATITGLELKDVNRLEHEFLRLLSFNLIIEVEEFVRVANILPVVLAMKEQKIV